MLSVVLAVLKTCRRSLKLRMNKCHYLALHTRESITYTSSIATCIVGYCRTPQRN